MIQLLTTDGLHQCKSKAIPVAGRGGLYGCETPRIPHCLDNRLTDGGEAVKPYAPAALYSPETFSGTHFCWRLA
jgi:hypothetical protein